MNTDLLKEFSPEQLQAHLDRIGHRKKECTGCEFFSIRGFSHDQEHVIDCKKISNSLYRRMSVEANDLAEFNKNAKDCEYYKHCGDE